MVSNKIIEFAKEHGYETAEYLGKYQGNDAYSAIYKDDGELYCVGLTALILETSKGLKWINDSTVFEILDSFPEEDENGF